MLSAPGAGRTRPADRARRLSAMDAGADGTRFQVAALVRERNRVLHALDRATERAGELGHVSDAR